MTRIAFAFLLLFVSVFLEILAETNGFRLLLTAPIIFYLTYAFGSHFGAGAAIAAGCVLDFTLGYTNPWSCLFLLAVVGFALFWLYQTESDSLISLIIPGLILPAIAQMPPSLIQGGLHWSNILDTLSDCILCGILSAIFFPCLILILDFIGSRLSLELFADAKERLRNRSSSNSYQPKNYK